MATATAKAGDRVSVHYTGTLASGDEFDSSSGGAPLEFVLGAGQMIPGFDAAVHGMAEGDKKTFTVTAADAYGPHHPEAVQSLDRDQLPDDMELELGSVLQAEDSQGHSVMLTVVDLTDDSVTLDANHPLAGQDLTFAIELVKIG
jgi:peptidylprolyl isomerase